jgi:2-polyprenyl-3-methyl-5-hydroxy-6-metoxy-1,4-benzoquinol methylase
LTWAVARRLPSLVRSAHASLWLRLLAPYDLADLAIRSYAAGAGFESQEHNFADLWPWEDAAFRQWFHDCEHILIAGAGGGREMIALARMGFEVTGFDASAELVAACRSHLRQAGIRADIYHAPPSRVPDGLGHYDGLLIGRGVYHHIAGRQERIAFLTDCVRHLGPGDPVIIGDFLARGEARPASMGFPIWAPKEVGDFINSAYFHFFTETELGSELDQAGCELLEFTLTDPGATDLAHAIARVKFHV